MGRLLIVDDDPLVCRLMVRLGEVRAHEILVAPDLTTGLRIASERTVDVVLLDVYLPDGNGLEAISALRSCPSSPEVIVITGRADLAGAEAAIRSGAWDYISKPDALQDLMLPVDRALRFREAKSEHIQTVSLKHPDIVAESPRMAMCLDQVAQAAMSEANVLICGETGTGKELLANAVHKNSARAGRPFVVVDCAALPENLVESVLFGHEKGAFTGADRTRKGLIAAAAGGTLFLDEVGELTLPLQKSFLRVLEERRFRPLGSLTEEESDFRLVAATNRNIDEMVAAGLFREDLLYRLRTITISVPPLRERKEDTLPLLTHFGSRMNAEYGRGVKGFSTDFVELVLAYHWPGNVRQLKQALESSYLAAGPIPELVSYHLPQEIRVEVKHSSLAETKASPASTAIPAERVQSCSLKQAREMYERHYFATLLENAGGNVELAASISGLSKSRFYAQLRRHRIRLQ